MSNFLGFFHEQIQRATQVQSSQAVFVLWSGLRRIEPSVWPGIICRSIHDEARMSDVLHFTEADCQARLAEIVSRQ